MSDTHPILEKWAMIMADPFQAPEIATAVLNGLVYGHPRHHDGKRVSTSRVKGKRDGRVVTFSGSEYILGEVAPNYEKAFPGARERLMKSLPKV